MVAEERPKEDDAVGAEKKKDLLTGASDRRVLMRGWQAGNQSYVALAKASWGCCVGGRGATDTSV